ncbi:unnamed protein product [Didymodactylos carnosus]|uniref:Tudor domain-containing protein 1 n=1 Tax=Didymodactylos carnosus TaxID=1234261 RepID=A0A813NHB0_9BILA|nr:unnamed protein product [Didymodactylos carnosus]CAF0778680.1 unnamed protein product [Didymodactylos carnosus]CAF3517748.1 unnamed protein product [Didymodactylos carnosus]CAF3560067.1 unnamed protein product [Didymodactylos carnosus]
MGDYNRKPFENSVVVKNLPLTIIQEELRAIFEQAGKVSSTKILPPNPSYDTAVGFVNFLDSESTQQAITQLNNFIYQNHTLRVQESGGRPRNLNGDRLSNGNSSSFRQSSFSNFPDKSNLPSSQKVGSDTNSEETSAPKTPWGAFRTQIVSNGNSSDQLSSRYWDANSTDNNRSSVNKYDNENDKKSMWTPQSQKSSSTSGTSNQTLTGWQKEKSEGSSSSSSSLTRNNGSITPPVTVNQTLPPSVITKPLVMSSSSFIDIREHEPLVCDKTYSVYLSNLDLPNVVYAMLLEDYVNATLLITTMNKHEQLASEYANTYKYKPTIGRPCAAKFKGDWYRGRVLAIEENRVEVYYVDWGNKQWCNAILEIRQLPMEYYKDPACCIRCVLDDVTDGKIGEKETAQLLEILVLDTKLDMTVTRIASATPPIPHVQLIDNQRNLNREIRTTVPVLSSSIVSDPLIDLFNYKPTLNENEIYKVQLAVIDAEDEMLHVILIRDVLATIIQVLKDWNNQREPIKSVPNVPQLVCAQFTGDDLWYRAWIKSCKGNTFSVYYVDFGNDENLTLDRLTECPQSLRQIPWLAVQVRLHGIKVTNDERYALLRDFESKKLDMKIISKEKGYYNVELSFNSKTMTNYLLEQRDKDDMASSTVNNDEDYNGLPKETNSYNTEAHVEHVQPPVPPPISVTTATPVIREQARIQKSPEKIKSTIEGCLIASEAPIVTEVYEFNRVILHIKSFFLLLVAFSSRSSSINHDMGLSATATPFVYTKSKEKSPSLPDDNPNTIVQVTKQLFKNDDIQQQHPMDDNYQLAVLNELKQLNRNMIEMNTLFQKFLNSNNR